MMGEQTSIQAAPFHEFDPARRVPAGHLLRAISRTSICPASGCGFRAGSMKSESMNVL